MDLSDATRVCCEASPTLARHCTRFRCNTFHVACHQLQKFACFSCHSMHSDDSHLSCGIHR